MQSQEQEPGHRRAVLTENQLKINVTHARLKELVNVIGTTKKNMNYVNKDLNKARSLHQSLRREVETLTLLTNKSEYYASTPLLLETNLMKFNHLVERNAKTADPMDEQIKQKQDPFEVLSDLEGIIHSTKRSGRREEIQLADKFKQRIIHDFEREGRQYSKAWITRFSHANTFQGNGIIEYIKRMKEIDLAFDRMKKTDCEMDIEELVKAVKTSYTKNNDCIAQLSGVEGQIIEIEGKLAKENRERNANLERMSQLNSERQTDAETKLRIENYIRESMDK